MKVIDKRVGQAISSVYIKDIPIGQVFTGVIDSKDGVWIRFAHGVVRLDGEIPQYGEAGRWYATNKDGSSSSRSVLNFERRAATLALEDEGKEDML